MSEEYVIEDDFTLLEPEAEVESRKERKAREREEHYRFFRFMLKEHREVAFLQAVALAAAAIALVIVLVFHPPSDSGFREARDAIEVSSLPQLPAVLYLAVGLVSAFVIYFWPLISIENIKRRSRHLAIMGLVALGLAAPLLAAGFNYMDSSDIGEFLLALVLYGELLVYSAPLALVAAGIMSRRQEISVAGMVFIVGSIFAGLNDPELDFNLMEPSAMELALIYSFALSLLFFMEGTYLSIRLTIYLETIYSGGTGVPAELNITRIVRTFLLEWVIAAGVAIGASYFALNYNEAILGLLPEVMRSSREMAGVYGKVIFSTIFLLTLVVIRLVMPDLSRRFIQISHSDGEGDGKSEESESARTRR